MRSMARAGGLFFLTLAAWTAASPVLAQATDAWRLQLSPHGAPLLGQLAEWRVGQSVALLVGPEGGLSAAEVSRAEAAGFRPASLGRTTLRTELAGVAALGALVAFGALRGIG